jgi:hypothetical protein
MPHGSLWGRDPIGETIVDREDRSNAINEPMSDAGVLDPGTGVTLPLY